jgi:hypothetical protein
MVQYPIITNFQAGELSEKLHGRTDLETYYRGLAEAENCLLMPQGGVTKRPGSVYVSSTNSGAQARIFSYVFNQSYAYLIECGANYIRIYRDGAVVQTITTNVNYSISDVWNLQVAQDYSGMWFVCDGDEPRKLTHTAVDTFTWGTLTYTTNVGEDAAPPFTASGNKPRAVAIFAGRLWFASTANQPQTIWATAPYDYDDYTKFSVFTFEREQLSDPSGWADPQVPETETVSEDRNVTTAAHAIEITIGSDENDVIQWMAPGSRGLVIGTTSGEWVIPKTITAINPAAELMSRYGSTAIQGKMVGTTVMFTQSGGKKVREYHYTNEADAFMSPDLTLLSDHVAGAGFTEFAHQREPDSNVFFVRSDGGLGVLSYDRNAGLVGWQRWLLNTYWNIESVAVLPESGKDVLYAVIYNGTARDIIKFSDTFFDSLEEAMYLDCAYDIATDALTLVSGNNVVCDWLANQEVCVVVDGAVYSTPTADASGVIDITGASGTNIHVGVKYSMKLKTMKLDTKGQYGPGHMQLKRVSNVFARLYRTKELKLGYDGYTDIESYDLSASGWHTEDVEADFDGDLDRDAHVHILSDNPLPCTLLALMPEVTT